jgi:hypothetical protein
MQRTTGHSTVTTTTPTGFTFGLVGVGANAVRGASRSMIADSKRSEPGKPAALVHRHDAAQPSAAQPSTDSWRQRASTDMRDVDQRDGQARLARTESYCLRAESVLPPRLWASWVLSQSLCG